MSELPPTQPGVDSQPESRTPVGAGIDLRSLGAKDRERMSRALADGWRLTPATMAVKLTMGRWIAARHLLYISTIVATEIAKGNARIIVTMPARHGKSEFLSVNTPIWFLEHWPDKYVMNISYGLELATDFSLKVRDTFLSEDNHHLLRTRIRQDKKRVDRYLTTGGGGLTAAGIGGPLTGRGAHLMLIDDYIKNAEASLSESQRKNTWEWFKSTAYTRLEPGGSLVILATRWNVNDLIGMCLQEMPNEGWKVINLPALALENDPLGRQLGEALWPERYSKERLLKIRDALGNYWWQAMYQQQPLPSMSGADLGSKLKIIDPDSVPTDLANCKRVRAWDLASTDEGGDYTAGPLMMFHKPTGDIIITDMQHHQKTPRGNEMMVLTCAEHDGHGVQIFMEQEPGSAGKTVIEHYAKLLEGHSFTGERATGPIEVRAAPFLAAVEAGKVKMVRGDWNGALVNELNGFPDGDHDDQIVACALGYNKLVKGLYGGITWGRTQSNVTPIHRALDIRKGKSKGEPGALITGLTW